MKILASRRLLCISIGLASVVSHPSFAQAPFAPEIYMQPQSRTVNPGGSVILSVEANGFPSLQYRWWKNGQLFTSQTNTATLVLPAAVFSAGSYFVVITNIYGSVTSSVATLTVNTQAPGISSEPQSQVACTGGTAVFSATATFGLTNSGGAYQWQLNDLDLPGRGGSSSNVFLTNAIRLILTNIAVAEAGNYTLILSNAYGMGTSAVASLTVDPPVPIITQQPKSIATFVGNAVSFAVAAAACAPLTYQWRSNGVNLAGANSNRLSLFGVSEQAGLYDVIVTSAGNSATSHVAWLVASNFPPLLTCQPQSRTVFAGSNATFFVCASGQPPLSYLWRHDAAPIDGATNSSSYTVRSAALSNAGNYDVVVTNTAGAVTSAVATLTVLVTPPTIITNPVSQSFAAGQTAVFTVQASGAPPPLYQWQKDGSDMPGRTNSILLITSVAPADAGNYAAVAYNIGGSVTGAVVTLTVTPAYPPTIVSQPENQTVHAGGGVIFWVSATGSAPLEFQWFHDGMLVFYLYYIAEAAADHLSIFPVSVADAGDYFAVVSNGGGAVTSKVAHLTVAVDPPSITYQPGSLTIAPGSPRSAYLYVGANGGLPLSFQWFHDGQPVPTSASNDTFNALYVGPITTNDAGRYFVVVSNIAGMVTSVVTVVTVAYIPPGIYFQPSDSTVYIGNFAQFCVESAGSLLLYQWQKEETDLPGATNACYDLYSATTNSAGNYRVIVSNPAGSVTSVVARLTVLPNTPRFITQPINQDAGLGAGVTLYASSTNGWGFQWLFNGQPLPSPGYLDSSYLWLDNVQTNQAGNYSAMVTNWDGAATSAVVTLTVPSGPLDHWQWRNPQPQGNDLYHAAYGDDRIVAVGNRGAKVVSADGGTTWQAHNKSGADLARVVYGNGLFVGISPYWLAAQATGSGYRLQTSTNGVDWTERRIGLTNLDQLLDVAFGNGRFVAVANFGGVIFSTNGVDWERSQWTDYWNMGHVTFGNGLFLLTDRGGATVSCAVSSDGVTWTNSSLPGAGYVFDLTFGNGQFAILGNTNYPYPTRLTGVFSTSTDAQTWTTVPMDSTNMLWRFAQGKGKFVALSSYDQGIVASSTDGATWTTQPIPTSNNLFGITFCNDRFVAVGNFGTMLTSEDGENWQPVNTNTSANLRSMAHGNGRYVAVGNEGVIFTSTEGSNWTRMTLPTMSNLRGVAFGAGTFVSVGEPEVQQAAPYTTSNTIFISNDGLAWTRPVLDTFNSPTGMVRLRVYDLYSITYAAGVFVAVGENGSIITSTNGSAWLEQISRTTHRLNSVTYGGGRFVAVGKKGWITTSVDGSVWSAQSYGWLLNNSTHFLEGIAHGNGVYVAAGQGGGLLVSSDALNWWAPASPFVTPYYRIDIEDVQFANGMFIAVGSNGLIATSTNGLFWTRHYSGCANDLRGAFYADCHFFAVGNNETILESDFSGPPILRLAGAPGGGAFGLSVSSALNGNYRLQVSTNLRDWNDMAPITNALGNLTWPATDPSSSPRRFYRAVSP